MSEIKLNVTEHLLTITNLPIMAAGSKKVDTISATFDPSWLQYAKIVVFCNKNGNINYSLMQDDIAIIPSETLKKGEISIGIMGVTTDKQITTNMVRVNIKDGACVELNNPEQNIYNQVLSNYGAIEKAIKTIRKELETKTQVNDFKVTTQDTYSSKKIEKLLAEVNYKKANLKYSFTGSSGGYVFMYQIANIIIMKFMDLLSTGTSQDRLLFTYPNEIGVSLNRVYEKINNATISIAAGSRDVKITTQGGNAAGTVIYLVNQDTIEGDSTLNDLLDSISFINNNIDFAFENIDILQDAMMDIQRIKADRILNYKSGETVSLTDSTDSFIQGNMIIGKSIQQGRPEPRNMIDIINAGYSGSITQKILGNNAEQQTIMLSIKKEGLAGIPVTDNGNYTDSNGQQWIADSIEYLNGSGKYIKRIGKKVFNGTENFEENEKGYLLLNMPNCKKLTSEQMACMCNYYQKGLITWTDESFSIEEGTLWFGDKNLSNFKNVAGFKNFLSQKAEEGKPLEIIYQLAIPEENELDEETVSKLKTLKTYYNTTTINNDAGAFMNICYIADTKSYIDNKFAELKQQITSMEELQCI